MAKILLTKETVGQSSNTASVESGKPVDLKIGYIGGGSRGWAHGLMNDLAQNVHFNGEVRLYDINFKLADFNAKFGNWVQTNPKAVSKWKYRAVRDIKDCLKDADIVFLSIQPGPIEYMGVDLLEPMKYGIYQPVGDTVGPGGIIRSLRTIKDYLVFAEAIKKYAPKAWCINFTNPMTMCTRTLYEGFPEIKAWGCCHEAFKAQHDMAKLYAEKTGEKEPRRDELSVNILGINHFTWINKAEYKGTDLFKMYMEHVRSPKIVSKFGKSKGIKKDQYFSSQSQVSHYLTKTFGAIAAAGDRHLAEFVPWFLLEKNSCRRWGFNLTPFSYRTKRYRDAPIQFAKTLKSMKHQELHGSGEEYINQMMAITGKTTFVTNVNLPNKGQHLGLPLGAVVETNAVFSAAGVNPVNSGSLPEMVTPLVLRHVINQENVIKAVVTRNEELAFKAFASDPLVGHIALDDAEKLFKTMVKKTNFKF